MTKTTGPLKAIRSDVAVMRALLWPAIQPPRPDLEGRQPQRRGQGQAGIAQQRVRQAEAPSGLELLLRGLGREPEQPRAEPGQLGVVVTKGAGLRGAAARPRNLVPAGWRVLTRPSGPRVAEQHQRAGG